MKSKASTVKELIALAKAKPDMLNFGSSGNGAPSHLAGEMFKSATGTRLVHVPYKGGGQALTDVLGGNIPLVYTAIAGAIPHVKSGKLLPIAVSSSKRASSMPEVATFIENGVTDFEASSWVGLLAPAKTPRAIVARLTAELTAILNDPEVKERLNGMGITATPGTAESFGAEISRDLAKYGPVVKAAGIKAE
jgi:tripartite-type tricarboxylate transporter receptor subunit TctC